MEAGQLRADASRNRQALLASAGELIAEHGLDAPLDEIAQRACVGNATLYRRFPRRIDLIEAVFAERMAEHVQAVEEALEQPDPSQGLRHYINAIAALQVRDRGIADLITMDVSTAPEIEQLRARAFRGVKTLIERAQAVGELRDDCTMEDVLLLLQANAGVIERSNRAGAAASQRLVHVLLDGLRAEGASAGPAPPSARRIRAAMRERSRRFGFGSPKRDV
jgi:AcrR family transcriptional regulator